MVRANSGPAPVRAGPLLVRRSRVPVTAWKLVVPAALVLLAGCAGKGEITEGGISAVRTACPLRTMFFISNHSTHSRL